MKRFTEKITGPVLWSYKIRLDKDYRIGKTKDGNIEVCGGFVDKLAKYEDAEEVGGLAWLPLEVGDYAYVDSRTLPTKNMDFETEDDVPPWFAARVVSLRKNSKGWFAKLSVKAGWWDEWVDPETGPDGGYYEAEKYFTYPFSAIGKTVFQTREEAEKALKEMEKEN